MPTRPTLVDYQLHDIINTTSGTFNFQQPSTTQVGDLLIGVMFSYSAARTANWGGLGLPSAMPNVLWEIGFNTPDYLIVLYGEATVSGFANHSTTAGVISGSDSAKDRRGATLVFRGHRPIGVDGGPFGLAKNAVVDAVSTSEIYRQISLGNINATQLNTLLLGLAFAGQSVTSTSATGHQDPSGMTLLTNPTTTSGQQIQMGIWTQALTATGFTGSKTAGLTRDTGGASTWESDAGLLLAIRAPNSPPTAPGAFSVPSAGQTVQVGDVLNIDFGDSTDDDGDSISYDIEYQLNGGAWVSLVNNRSTSSYSWNTTGLSPGSYALRVRAKDGFTFGSYTTSATFNLVQGSGWGPVRI